jgi:amidase
MWRGAKPTEEASMTEPSYRSAFVPHDLGAPIYGAADGPLAGLTAAVKDLFDIAGTTTGNGNPTWLVTHPPATQNAAAVDKILAAGATIVGKTICDEFFYSVAGANAHYGTPVNPRAPGRVPGGSSSGSASAVAAGACDFALGSDTGGSVRIPAAFNGLYGLRPSHGRVDLTGGTAMAPSFDTAGWFTAGPGLSRTLGRVLLGGGTVPAKIVRLIVLEDAFEQADADVADLVKSGLELMSADLPAIQHGRIAPDGFDPWREAFRVLQAFEVWQTFGEFVRTCRPEPGPGVRERLEMASRVTPDEAAAARSVLAEARRHIRHIVVPGTVLALPTAPCIAPLADGDAGEMDRFRTRVMRLTCTAGVAGLPQINIPIGTLGGCPVGLSFIGWAGGDEALLDLACALGRHCGLAG